MVNYLSKMKKHPKILASIILLLIVGAISFFVGYKQDIKKTDKDGNKYSIYHHFWNGMKWLGIIYTIFIIIAICFAFTFSSDFVTFFLIGGEVLGGLFQLLGELMTALGN